MSYVHHAFGTCTVQVPVGERVTVADLAGALATANSNCPAGAEVTRVDITQAPDGAPRVVVRWAKS